MGGSNLPGLTYTPPTPETSASLSYVNGETKVEISYNPLLSPGPVFDIETGNIFGLSENGMKGVPVLISNSDLNKVRYSNGRYNTADLLKYSKKIYEMPLGRGDSPSQETIEAFNAVSKVINYIALQTPLSNFPDAPANVSTLLRNGQISTTYYGSSSWSSPLRTNLGKSLATNVIAQTNNDEHIITFNIAQTQSEKSDYLTTVENIQCVFVHELMGHWIRNVIGGENKGHYQAYDIQKQYINYGKTTENFKKHVENNRSRYFNLPNN